MAQWIKLSVETEELDILELLRKDTTTKTRYPCVQLKKPLWTPLPPVSQLAVSFLINPNAFSKRSILEFCIFVIIMSYKFFLFQDNGSVPVEDNELQDILKKLVLYYNNNIF